jgi:hypothetical protein
LSNDLAASNNIFEIIPLGLLIKVSAAERPRTATSAPVR